MEPQIIEVIEMLQVRYIRTLPGEDWTAELESANVVIVRLSHGRNFSEGSMIRFLKRACRHVVGHLSFAGNALHVCFSEPGEIEI